ncbi:MAG: Ig-like domain-containing protein, partial [Bacilli bacterium]
MRAKQKIFLSATIGLFATVAIVFTLLAASITKNVAPLSGSEPSYTITMNADNSPTSSSIYTNATREIRNSTFNYYGAKTSSGNHVELAETGHIMNALDSQITSITSIQTNFTTSGSLSLATSFDGVNFTQQTITSGNINQTSSLPYYFRLTANSASVAIQSVVIVYSCAPHAEPINQQQEYDIVVKDFACANTGTEISSSIASNISTYFTSELSITSFSGSKLFGDITPTATSIKAGSSSAVGSFTFNFASLKVSQVIVNAYKYGSDTVSIKVTTSADSTGKTISIPATTGTNYTFDLVDANNSTSLTLLGVGKRFHLESLTIISEGSSAGSPIETGFNASDSNATTYLTNSIYSSANNIVAQASMTSGSPVTLNYDATGVNGYSYLVKNANNEQINASVAFGEVGTYYAIISYKAYPKITIELTVSEVPVATLVSIAAADSNSIYQIGDIYDEDNGLVVTATYSDSSTSIIQYNSNGVDGYSIYCLDPDANEYYTSAAFTLAGDYLLTVTYQGVESNDVEFSVQTPSGGVTEATISVLTNTTSDSTSVASSLSSSPSTFLSASGVSIASVTASNIYGGGGQARLRFTSSGSTGSMQIFFTNEIVVNSVSLSVSQYSTKTSSVKVVTSANSTVANQSVSGTMTLAYTGFSGDVVPSSSITISSASGNQFYLHGVTLGLASSEPVSLTGVSLKTSTSLGVGASETLTPTFVPSNATNKNVTWSTNSNSVASVNNGVVTANAVGTAIITVTAEDGGHTAQCNVTVTAVQYDNYYKATSVDPNFNLQDIQQAGSLDSIPSPRTDLNILVIPMELTDYTFTTTVLTNINKLFNGTAGDTNYWESVSSFYEKTSYGNIDMNFTVAPKYNTGHTAAQA